MIQPRGMLAAPGHPDAPSATGTGLAAGHPAAADPAPSGHGDGTLPEIRALLVDAVTEAAHRATALGHPVIAVVNYLTDPIDPIRAFQLAGSSAMGFFERGTLALPADPQGTLSTPYLAYVAYDSGTGSPGCTSVTGTGWTPDHLGPPHPASGAAGTDLSSGTGPSGPTGEVFAPIRAWHSHFRDAVCRSTRDVPASHDQGPLAFGGGAFDPSAPRSALWSAFPAALFFVPRILLTRTTAGTTIGLHVLVRDRAQGLADAMEVERMANSWLLRIASQPELAPMDDKDPGIILRDGQPAEQWREIVARLAGEIRAGAMRKVVLARSVHATGTRAFVAADVLRRLRVAYPAALRFAIPRGNQVFVGATPEYLAEVNHGAFTTMALAGTAPRGTTPDEDAALGLELLHNAKQIAEHAIVTEMLRTTLAPLCATMQVGATGWPGAAPQLLRLANVQHLQTPIAGQLMAGRSILDLVAALHPTPAVGGMPRVAALAAIRAAEGMDRGWYAGPVGWVTPDGDGAMAVALRSGLLNGQTATLFAGCGIVGASDPDREWEESRLKLQAMLSGIGLEEAPR